MFDIATSALAETSRLALSVTVAATCFAGFAFTEFRRRKHNREDAKLRAKKKDFRYCPICSTKLVLKSFAGKEKKHCQYCNWTHWNGPAVVSIAVVFSEDGKKVLLVKRTIPPAIGKHAHAGGFVETGEGLIAGAKREGVEETGAELKILEFLMEFPIAQNNEILVFWLAEQVGGELKNSDETEAVGYYDLDKLPEIAFPSHKQAIELALERRNAGKGLIQPK